MTVYLTDGQRTVYVLSYRFPATGDRIARQWVVVFESLEKAHERYDQLYPMVDNIELFPATIERGGK